jgi:CRISPR-associated endonuclease Csn1
VATILGLDIGSNSVGSAWIDTERELIDVGVTVFPAGVEDSDSGRGAPNNQKRRSKRSLRRSLARRSARKRKLRMFLSEQGFLPRDRGQLQQLMTTDAWQLRRRALVEPLTPFEFGRILLHLCQRRGALGLKMADESESGEDSEGTSNKRRKKPSDDDNDGKVRVAVEETKKAMLAHQVPTFGALMATLSAERRSPVFTAGGQPKIGVDGQPITYAHRIRNKNGVFEFHADRAMLREEFERIWRIQQSFPSALAIRLTESLKRELDNPKSDKVWRHQGLLFGQRRTYWNTGSLGRCTLEPTDQCVPIADRHASYYRVVETVNNIRLRGPGDIDFKPLTAEQRASVIRKLRRQKTGTIPAICDALNLPRRGVKKQSNTPSDAFVLNLERDEERLINTDWFYRAIVLEGVGETVWESWDELRREGLNRAILRFDPALEEDTLRLKSLAIKIGLDSASVERLVAGWRTRPKLEVRLKMSRRAVLNLIPYMEEADENGHWPTQIEARMRVAADERASDQITGQPMSAQQRERYRLGVTRLNKRDRYYLRKHPERVLPPAPTLANPVVRKAIHEVRRHVIAHIRAHGGQRPDRIIIEFARETTKSARQNDEILHRNRLREKIRRQIREELIQPILGENQFYSQTKSQLRAAENRVILCRQQDGKCAYSGSTISERQAVLGDNLEIDHVVPYSRSGDDGLNNKVLCMRDANRNKQNKTPREWWGADFEINIQPMRHAIELHKADSKKDYFTRRDYATKWRNLTREEVPAEWKGSQLTDTAYAAKEVMAYLQQSLWPHELTHLASDSTRRIFVTKGAYTAQLRRDWQLYHRVFRDYESRDAREQGEVKDRGDHRQHAIDAVAIAFTDPTRIQALSTIIKQQQESRMKAKNAGIEPPKLRREPLPTPWGNPQTFRRQVLSLIYDEFDDQDKSAGALSHRDAIVVSHRPVGKKITGALHEETLFGPIPNEDKVYTGSISVNELKAAHLRERVPESTDKAIERFTQLFLKNGIETTETLAKKRARQFITSKSYVPKLVDPSPGKSGLVRDIGIRRQIRRVIEERLRQEGIDKDANSFNDKDLMSILSHVNPDTGRSEDRPLTMPSGVPVKRLVVLRTHTDPVTISRRRWNQEMRTWEPDDSERSARVHVSGNNHHIEIRDDGKGDWKGIIVPMFEAAKRARLKKVDPIDRADDPERGGRFVMSLSLGETVYLADRTGNTGYWVVVKLEKPDKVVFKAHWDARRDSGEKDEQGQLVHNSKRETIRLSAKQLKEHAPHGETTPIKVLVDPLGKVHRVEPLPQRVDSELEIDPRVLSIAREALTARRTKDTGANAVSKRRRCHGSWTWMRARLKREKLEHLAAQLSAAVRFLQQASK